MKKIKERIFKILLLCVLRVAYIRPGICPWLVVSVCFGVVGRNKAVVALPPGWLLHQFIHLAGEAFADAFELKGKQFGGYLGQWQITESHYFLNGHRSVGRQYVVYGRLVAVQV